MGHRILVVDDDYEFAGMLKTVLELRNHEVTIAGNGHEGMRKTHKTRPDLVVLDIYMPEMDGWQFGQRLRELADVPIVFLTGCATQQAAVKALTTCADDFITKPFKIEELEARINAVLRRYQNRDNGASRRSFYSNGHLTVDFDRRVVKVRGKEVRLTPIEFNLLSCFVRYEGRVLPHEFLLAEVWGSEQPEKADKVKHYIRYLRQKIEDDPAKPDYIQTEWGVGYRLREG